MTQENASVTVGHTVSKHVTLWHAHGGGVPDKFRIFLIFLHKHTPVILFEKRTRSGWKEFCSPIIFYTSPFRILDPEGETKINCLRCYKETGEIPFVTHPYFQSWRPARMTNTTKVFQKLSIVPVSLNPICPNTNIKFLLFIFWAQDCQKWWS